MGFIVRAENEKDQDKNSSVWIMIKRMIKHKFIDYISIRQ